VCGENTARRCRVVPEGLSSLWRFAFSRFVAVGLLNTVFGYSFYALLILIGIPRLVAVTIAKIVGTLFNFRTTGVLVFYNRDNRRLWRFLAVYGLGYPLNVALLEFWCRLVGTGPLVGQALSLPVVVVFTFLMMKTLVFRQDSTHGADAPEAHQRHNALLQ
jgi:putative flippase GtrA